MWNETTHNSNYLGSRDLQNLVVFVPLSSAVRGVTTTEIVELPLYRMENKQVGHQLRAAGNGTAGTWPTVFGRE